MEGCARSLLVALCCCYLIQYISSQAPVEEPTPASESSSGSVQFQEYLEIDGFEFGKLHQDLLNPKDLLVARQSSIARLHLNNTDFEETTIVGSKSEKNIIDAIGNEARFFYIFDVAQITDQKIWIASELTYNCLRKIDVETLDVSTFSGTCDSQAGTDTRIGPVSETKWSLPGLMSYVEETQKLYVSANGGIRVIDMDTEEVEVFLEAIDPIYDLILTSQNTLLMLHNSKINEVDPTDPSDITTTTRWSKDEVTDVQFSFVFDVTKVDDERLIMVDDTQGLYLLNLLTGDLVNICPGGLMTVATGAEVKCYEEPAAIQHISYINNNMYILSYWSGTDVDSSFELGVFLGSSLPTMESTPKEEVTEEAALATTETSENVTMFTANTTESMPTVLETVSAENSTSTINTTEVMNNTTTANNETETTNEDEMMTTPMVNVTSLANETLSMNETSSTNETSATTEMPAITEMSASNETTAAVTTMEIEGNDTSSNMTEPGVTTEFVSTAFPEEMETDMTTEETITKFIEEKTPEPTEAPQKPGKAGAGASMDNGSNRHGGFSFICWSVFATAVSMLY